MFADMPLDNLTVDQIRGSHRRLVVSSLFETLPPDKTI
jgi:hypothetical protein